MRYSLTCRFEGGRLAHTARSKLVFAAVAVIAGAVAFGVVNQKSPAASESPPVREFTLTAEEIDWELQPGVTVRAWAYNGQVPGPEIRVREGDLVRITLVNKLPVGTTAHWHGLDVPPEMDGPAGLNQAPVEPGESFVYEYIATPAGTRWYHSHTDVATQVMLGLYGPMIVEPVEGAIEVDRDDTYILSEWDSELTPDVATGVAPRGPRDTSLRGGELGTDYFLLNGKMHEAIPPIAVREGDQVLIRLINAGTMAHPFHIHGHSFRIVATDGNPVPPAAQLTKDTVLIAPGERYDILFNANNPGVWMAHCHIENHAANGMMTLIEYEGEEPTGPLKEFWGAPGTNQGIPSHSAPPGQDGHDLHSASATATPDFDAVQEPPGNEPDSAADGGDTVEITMLDDRYDPKTLDIKAGTTVTWVNMGGNWHSVAAFDGSFESGQIDPGGVFSHTFTEAGTYQFICKHHGRQGMMGQIVVTE